MFFSIYLIFFIKHVILMLRLLAPKTESDLLKTKGPLIEAAGMTSSQQPCWLQTFILLTGDSVKQNDNKNGLEYIKRTIQWTANNKTNKRTKNIQYIFPLRVVLRYFPQQRPTLHLENICHFAVWFIWFILMKHYKRRMQQRYGTDLWDLTCVISSPWVWNMVNSCSHVNNNLISMHRDRWAFMLL